VKTRQLSMLPVRPCRYGQSVTEHSILAFSNGLSARLAPRSRHVGVFMGAGTSKACGLPDIVQLTEAVKGDLAEPLKGQFSTLVSVLNLEEALTKLRRIAAIAGTESIGGLNADQARQLDAAICDAVIARLTQPATSMEPILLFAAWVARATYARPVELFTVNYDLLIESALESWGVPYFDGFVGTLRAAFRADLVETLPSADEQSIPAFFARLWKLHGSANWGWDADDLAEVRRMGAPIAPGQIAAIYPSDSKYDQSRRMPFVVLQDRLRKALNEPETLMLVSGYAWGDQHINEMFFEATIRRPRSEVIAFCYSKIPDELAAKALITPNLQVVAPAEAILGGVRAAWAAEGETPHEGVWKDGKARFGDFSALAAFLAKSAMPSVRLEEQIAAMLAEQVAPNA